MSKEFRLKTDNDLYVSPSKDRYYTNGMFLTFRHLSKKTKNKLEKTIFEWEVGHKMYSPFKATVSDISMHDRPFAGYLYGSFGKQRVYKNKILTLNLQLGVIGPNALGEELQDLIHQYFNFKKAIGWKHQIKNAPGINLKGSYRQGFIKVSTSHFDLTWTNHAQIGTVFTNLSTGFFTRIGMLPLQEMMNSIAFNTSLNNSNTGYKSEKEAFLYAKTTVHYTLYDATLQGSFLNKRSEITNKITPFHLGLEFGVSVDFHQLNLRYAYIYTGRKSEGLRFNNGNYYGSIQLSYLFN
ncbi:lipid A deacylase LpxR family protein [Polaribacter sp.]|nr:lipid A deacylase LpxR family protein [Polaribacter sp.]MDC1432176.1 lipid A deacylase LpxR family protein [Polaribacter sp.]